MNTDEQVAIAADAGRNIRTITLDKPISRGGTAIETVTIRKPEGGALRGLSLALLGQADYDTLEKLIPRITSPVIHKEDISSGALDSADLMQISIEIMDFLCPAAARRESPPQ